MLQRLLEQARAYPARTAILLNDRPISYADFAGRILALRQHWAASAPAPGCLVVLPSLGPLDNWCAVLALRSLGLTTVCLRSLDPRQLPELNQVACVVVRDASELTRTPWHHAIPLTYPPFLPIAPLPGPAALLGPIHAGAHILLSSGTTGRPKKLVFDGALEAERAERSGKLFGDHAGTVLHTADFGLWTGIGYKWPQRVWHCGGAVIIDLRPDWPDHFFTHAPTAATLVPQKAAQLLGALGAVRAPRARTNLYLSGAQPSANLVQGLLNSGYFRLIHHFGATEVLPYCMGREVDDPAELSWLRVQPGRQVEVVTEDGTPCRDDEPGQLRVRLGPLDCTSYLDDPETTAKVFRDGCFHPGDLAVRRADGCIQVLGRADDVINVNGNKIACGPVEEAIREALDASAVCAFSGLGAEGENIVVLAVETVTPIAPERIHQAAGRLYGIGQLRFVQFKAFPRTQGGTLKIDRLALRRQVMSATPPAGQEPAPVP